MKLSRFFCIYLPLLLLAVGAGLLFGGSELSPGELWAGLWEGGTAGIILRYVRLPRVLAGALAGLGLSAAGVLLQTVTANELAGPNIIGINSGAGLAVILMLTLLPELSRLLPLGAFLGALTAALLILLLAGRFGSSRSIVLLLGIAVTTLLNACISFLSLLDEDVLAEYNHFTLGSLKGVSLEELALPALLILGGFLGAMALSGQLRVLILGDSAAAALGIRVRRLRLLALGCGAACAAAVVSFAGLLGFVGLVVPHIARAHTGNDPRRMLPAAGLLGAIVVILADTLGRTLFAPSELPVGILMSLIGAPYFCILLTRRRSHADAS